MRYGWHLVTKCHKAKQGNKSSVESILIHYFNTNTHITATKAKPFSCYCITPTASLLRASA